MIHLATTINEWVEQKLNLPKIYNDILPEIEKDGICLRHDPSPAVDRRFIDGTRLLKWDLTYFVKCKKAEKARALLYEITNALDGAEINAYDKDINDYVIVTAEAQTLPQFVSKDDKGYTLYTASISCTYIEEN